MKRGLGGTAGFVTSWMQTTTPAVADETIFCICDEAGPAVAISTSGAINNGQNVLLSRAGAEGFPQRLR